MFGTLNFTEYCEFLSASTYAYGRMSSRNVMTAPMLICYNFIEMLFAPGYQSRKCRHQ